MDEPTAFPSLPFLGDLQQTSTSSHNGRLHSPQITPKSSSFPSLTPDQTTGSVCSDACSQRSCDDCCGEDDCDADCAESCHSIEECDAETCTKPACDDEVCLENTAPRFDERCLHGLTDEDIAAAANLIPHNLAPDHSWLVETNHTFPAYPGSLDVSHDSLISPDYQLSHSFAPQHVDASSTYPDPFAQFGCLDQANITDTFDCPPAKRRKSNPTGLSAVPNNYTLTNLDGLPPADDIDPLYCQWGTQCDQGFYDLAGLQSHISTNHVKPQSEIHCRWSDCDEFGDSDTILSHVAREHTQPVGGAHHVCLWAGCRYSFRDADDLVHHFKTVHVPPLGELSCQWDACGAIADDPSVLREHLETDHLVASVADAAAEHASGGEEPGSGSAMKVCQWIEENEDAENVGQRCGDLFPTADALQEHVREAHVSVLKKKTGYICRWEGCGRRENQPFSQRGKLERHIQVHTGFKSCQCSICGNVFSAPQALAQHRRTHTGEKPYKCELCGKEFAQGSALTMHRRTHTKERPLKCDYPGCNKSFSESSNLSKHRKSMYSIDLTSPTHDLLSIHTDAGPTKHTTESVNTGVPIPDVQNHSID
ncbi:MAG: zinc-finger protein [Caeruleum heppii]|nr:MAG: zinc-finger protein [Caeruleum heppii]